MIKRIENYILDKLGIILVLAFMMILFFFNIRLKILKFIRTIYRFILKYGIIIIISLYVLISLFMLFMREPKVDKPFSVKDQSIIEKHINAQGKDILIILDLFERKSPYADVNRIIRVGSHGEIVANKFFNYYKFELKKDKLDILPILISFDLKKYTTNELRIQVEKKSVFLDLTTEGYSLENYIKLIRELNPNSKIVLSTSFFRLGFNEIAVSLSKKYDLKLAQAYLNSHGISDWFYYLQTHLFFDKTNALIVHNGEVTPLLYNVKKVSYLDIDIDREDVKNRLLKEINYNNQEVDKNLALKTSKYNSTSILTPILAYEYYLNPDSNLIKK